MTEYVVFFVGIIPNIHMKPAINNTAGNKLNYRYYHTSGKTAENKTASFDFDVHNINHKQCSTARNCHCPMRKAAKKHLNQIINYSARAENNKIFFEFIHNITDIRITV